MVANSAIVELACFRISGRRRQDEMITRMEESFAAFRDEAKQYRKPEPGALRESAVSTQGAGCRDENSSGSRPEVRYFS
jgi:hypothetical protein